MNQETKICQNCKASFQIDAQDFAFYEKMGVPAPTFCPECREQRRIAVRNERALYKRKCDLCDKEVISRVSPDKKYPMYCKNCWWSDKWDAVKYGRDYDFSRPFFEQFKDLLFSVPHISIFNANTVNSDWVNQETDDKNCYLNVGGHYNEDSAYNTYELFSKDSFDNYWLFKSELCYENLNCERCYRISFSQECLDSQDIAFCYDCRNCQNCLGCAGLRHKQYWIFNQPSTRENYQKFLKENPLSSRKNISFLKEKAKKVWLTVPHRESFMVKTVNCSGNFLTESKNTKQSWNIEKAEDSKYLYIGANVKDNYDVSSYGGADLSYECSSSGGAYSSKFILYCMAGDPLGKPTSSSLEYCYAVIDCNNCFGCIGLRNKEFCILNKQYSKEEYGKIREKIIEQMNSLPYKDKKGIEYRYGEFFPTEISPFGYNETVAQEYFPLEKAEALERGYNWSDYEAETKYQFSDYQIPDDISDVKDDILEKILKCEVSGKPYRIIPMELAFYRRLRLPIPGRAPLQRHKDRMSRLLPRKLFQRQCQKCQKDIETSYSLDRPEIVYCVDCYQKEIN